MKKLYITLILALVSVGSWAQPFRGEVTVTPRTLEQRDGTLYMNLDITVEAIAANKCQSWMIIPELANDNGRGVTRTFPPVLVNGKNKRQMYERKERFGNLEQAALNPYMVVNALPETDVVAPYTVSVPYESWMDNATLNIRMIVTSCADRQQSYLVNTGVGTGPRAVAALPLVNYVMPDFEDKRRTMEERATVHYRLARHEVLTDFDDNSAQLNRIREDIQEIKNSNARIDGFYISGYASPEGTFAFNEKLALNRANALKNYISSNYGIPQEQFRIGSVAEDWAGLRELVVASNTLPQKEQVLQIIDSSDDLDNKERRLKALGEPYRIILNDMFPQLRRAEYMRIDYTVREYTTQEARDLVDRKPEQLSQREIYQVAQSYGVGTERYNQIILLAQRLYPNDPVANINAAAVMISQGNYPQAKTYLDRANEDPRVYNNLGLYYLNTNQKDLARDMFMRANTVPEAQNNLLLVP